MERIFARAQGGVIWESVNSMTDAVLADAAGQGSRME